jgi:uncharacterized membrane protein
VTVAVVFSVDTVVLIIAHVDHLARGLQVGEITRGIAGEGEKVIAAMVVQTRAEAAALADAGRPGGQGFKVAAPHDGWVTQTAGRQPDARRRAARFDRAAGDAQRRLHPGRRAAGERVPAPAKVRHRLSATVKVAAGRTMQQDVDSAVRQLVDIGPR